MIAPASLSARLAALLDTHRGARHLDALDGLRGIAVLLVFLCHFQIVVFARLGGPFLRQPFFMLAELGATGVDLFFLLSGYLVYQAFLRPEARLWPFWIRRLRRIYPTFLVVLVLYLLLSFMLHLGEHFHPSGHAGWLGYVISNALLLPGVFDLPSIVYPAWSLSFELLFYLAMPLGVMLIHLRRWHRQSRCLLWGSLLVALLLLASVAPGLMAPRHYQQASPLVASFFFGGMLLAELLPLSAMPLLLAPRFHWSAGISILLTLSAFVALAWPLGHPAPHGSVTYAVMQNTLLLLLFGAAVLLALSSRGIVSTLCRGRVLRWTGNISYSLYLIHGLALDAVALLIPRFVWLQAHPLLAAPLLLGLCAALTLVLSQILFLAAERPLSLAPLLRH